MVSAKRIESFDFATIYRVLKMVSAKAKRIIVFRFCDDAKIYRVFNTGFS